MRTHSFLFALIGAATLAFTACEKELKLYNGDFPKKNLIEEFTGQDCQYCPMGMDCVHDFIKDDPNWIVVMHHTYGTDDFTVKGSSKIAEKLNVEGTPSITINREEISRLNDKGKEIREVVFHPGYLGYLTNSFAKTTYASVNIANTYDANSRKLHVKVTGQIGKADFPALKLTVLVKESGMIGYQVDSYNAFIGWTEFRHTNAVRAFLTETFGDPISIVDKNRSYTAEYDIELSDKWNAESCMVVAFLTAEEDKPVVQAEQSPVVSGSKGGADIQHGGITAAAVPDYYPEPNATVSTKDVSGRETDTLNVANAWGTINGNVIEWQLQAYNMDATIKYQGYNFVPFAWLHIYTDKNAQGIPAGTYQFTNTKQPGTAYAGTRDDAHQQIVGSQFYYIEINDFKYGDISYPLAQWLISDGTLTITDKGWSLSGHTRNGSTISLYGSTAIKNNGTKNAPAKKPALMMQNASQPRKMLPIIR